MSSRVPGLLALGVALLASCGGGAPEGLLLRLVLAPGVAIDHVEVSGAVGDDQAFAPAVFPEEWRPLSTGDSILLLLDETLIGEEVEVSLQGRRGPRLRATGSAGGVIVADKTPEIDVELLAPPPPDDGGASEPPVEEPPVEEPPVEGQPAAEEPDDDEDRDEAEDEARREAKHRAKEERRAEEERRREEAHDDDDDDDDDDE